MKIQKQAFTLVELIVVITILAILGTIAFISLQGYSTQARDSTRLSDISTMKTSLELFHLGAGKYPQPTDGVAITYSGGTVWTQGTFGNSVFINVDKLDKIPTDPLTDKKYTYSVTTNEYELAGMLEGDPLTFNPYMLDGAFAGTVEATAIVEGNYNGLMGKSLTGASTCYALALPTIVANDVSNPDLLQIMTNERLVYNGYKNLPSNLSSTKFDTTGGFAFGSGIPLVAYTDNASCGPLTNVDDSTARVSLINGLQTAYTSTILESVGEVAKIVNLTAGEEESYAASFVNNNLGGKIEIIINSNEEPGEFDLCSVQGDILSSTSTYGTCDTLDIIVCSGESTGYTISSCNIGSSIAGLTNISYGNYFQWGRNKGFPEADSSSQSTIINGTIGLDAGTDTYGFVYNGSLPSPWTWADSDINDNWGELTNSQFARQGPCEIGYHVPSLAEWGLLHAAGGWANGGELSVGLNLPLAGYRLQNTGVIIYKTSNGYYWSSSYNTNNGEYLHFYSGGGSINSSWANDYRAKGMNIRCFKNN